MCERNSTPGSNKCAFANPDMSINYTQKPYSHNVVGSVKFTAPSQISKIQTLNEGVLRRDMDQLAANNSQI